MWKFLVPMGVFLALIVLFALGLNPNRDIRALPSPLLGKPAPAFELSDVLDPARNVSNASFQGQIYVFNAWGTWCVPCREEQETLLAIAKQGVVPIIGLNFNDDRTRAQRWLRELGNPYTAVAFDPDERVAIDWGVYGAPETFLVDQHGRVIYKYISPLTLEVWQTEFLPRIQAARRSGGA
jgi:cytochrome c biogenesis protein CcmG/thiol:disulfide interchange protein DsbE